MATSFISLKSARASSDRPAQQTTNNIYQYSTQPTTSTGTAHNQQHLPVQHTANNIYQYSTQPTTLPVQHTANNIYRYSTQPTTSTSTAHGQQHLPVQHTTNNTTSTAHNQHLPVQHTTNIYQYSTRPTSTSTAHDQRTRTNSPTHFFVFFPTRYFWYVPCPVVCMETRTPNIEPHLLRKTAVNGNCATLCKMCRIAKLLFV